MQGLTLRAAHLPGASKSIMWASEKFILLAQNSIKFNIFVCNCVEKLQFCAETLQFCDDDEDFSDFGQVPQDLNVKPWP